MCAAAHDIGHPGFSNEPLDMTSKDQGKRRETGGMAGVNYCLGQVVNEHISPMGALWSPWKRLIRSGASWREEMKC